ncbi:hypothetical protein BIW11_06885, partial [Tropilaelaps mercedesae]
DMITTFRKTSIICNYDNLQWLLLNRVQLFDAATVNEVAEMPLEQKAKATKRWRSGEEIGESGPNWCGHRTPTGHSFAIVEFAASPPYAASHSSNLAYPPRLECLA